MAADWQAYNKGIVQDESGRDTGVFVVYVNGKDSIPETIPLEDLTEESFKERVRRKITKLNGVSDTALKTWLAPGLIDTTPASTDPTEEQQRRSDFFKALGIAQRAVPLVTLGVLDDSQIVDANVKTAHDLIRPEYLE